MKCKNILVAFVSAFTILAVTPAFAQDKSNEERAKKMTENMKNDLSLTEDQYEKVYTINLAFINKATEVRNSDGGRLSKARKLKGADAERDKLLKGALTEEQYKTFKVQKKENRAEMKKRLSHFTP